MDTTKRKARQLARYIGPRDVDNAAQLYNGAAKTAAVVPTVEGDRRGWVKLMSKSVYAEPGGDGIMLHVRLTIGPFFTMGTLTRPADMPTNMVGLPLMVPFRKLLATPWCETAST